VINSLRLTLSTTVSCPFRFTLASRVAQSLMDTDIDTDTETGSLVRSFRVEDLECNSANKSSLESHNEDVST
jgi:hypothetical protein